MAGRCAVITNPNPQVSGKRKKAPAAAPSDASTENNNPILPYIIPQARDRWMSPNVSYYTPDVVEGILRSALSGNLLGVWQLFDLMEETWPHLSKCLNELKWAVQSMDLSVQAATNDDGTSSPAAEERAQFIRDLLKAFAPRPDKDENGVHGMVYDIMDAWGKGISVQQIGWERGLIKGKPAIYARSTQWVHPRYYGYPGIGADLMLDTSQIGTQINPEPVQYQKLNPTLAQFAPFPPNKFLISIHKQKSGNPIGGAMLRTLAWWWVAANFTSEWFLNYAQLFGIPFRWAEYDPNKPGLKELVSDMLQNMGSAGWAAMPAGTKLQFMDGAKNSSESPHVYLLKFADRICDIVVLHQTLSTDVGDSGSRALGDTHESVKGEVVEAAGTFTANVLTTQFVPYALMLNYGNTEDAPKIVLAAREVKDAKALAERDGLLIDRGVEMPAEWFYKRHEIPMPQAGQAVIKKPAAAPLMPGLDQPTSPEELAKKGQPVQAKDASEQLAENVLEDLTGVQAKWLAGVKPFFVRLAVASKSGNVSDAEFIQALEAGRKQFPELFEKLDAAALASSMENAMGAAVVNGAARGFMERGSGRRKA